MKWLILQNKQKPDTAQNTQRKLDIQNVKNAVRRVTVNNGSGGIGGKQTDKLREYLNANC